MSGLISTLHACLALARSDLGRLAERVYDKEGELSATRTLLELSREETAATQGLLRGQVVSSLSLLKVAGAEADALALAPRFKAVAPEQLRDQKPLMDARLAAQEGFAAACEAFEESLPVLARNLQRKVAPPGAGAAGAGAGGGADKAAGASVLLLTGPGGGHAPPFYYAVYPRNAPLSLVAGPAGGVGEEGRGEAADPAPAAPGPPSTPPDAAASSSLKGMLELMGAAPGQWEVAATGRRAAEREARRLAALPDADRLREIGRIELERAGWANREWDAARDGLVEALTLAWRHRRVSDWERCLEAGKRLAVAELGLTSLKLRAAGQFLERMMREREGAFTQAAAATVEAARSSEAAMELRGQVAAMKTEMREMARRLTRVSEPTLESLWYVREAAARKLVADEVALSREALPALLGQIFIEKMGADVADDTAGTRRQGMAEFVYDFFLFKFGLRSFAELHLAALLAAVEREAAASPRVRLFGCFCHSDKCPVLPDDSQHFFMYALTRLHAANDGLQPSELKEGVTRVKPKVAAQVAREVLAEALPGLDEAALRACDARVEGMVTDDGGTGSASRSVDLDELLTYLVELWSESYEANVEEMKALWQRADENGDGVLSFSEFSAMIKSYQPETLERRIKVMFRESVQLSGSSGDNKILPENFVAVARKYGLGALRVRFPMPVVNTAGLAFNELGFLRESWSHVRPSVLAVMKGMFGDSSLAEALRDLTSQTEALDNLIDRKMDTDSAWSLYRRIILGYTTEMQRRELTKRETDKATLVSAAVERRRGEGGIAPRKPASRILRRFSPPPPPPCSCAGRQHTE